MKAVTHNTNVVVTFKVFDTNSQTYLKEKDSTATFKTSRGADNFADEIIRVCKDEPRSSLAIHRFEDGRFNEEVFIQKY